MEDEKLADYYDELKAAAPKGGRGGLGAIKGGFKGGFGRGTKPTSAAGTNGTRARTLTHPPYLPGFSPQACTRCS